jgi:hypothetical protein
VDEVSDAVADQIRSALLTVAHASQEKRSEVIASLGRFGWELRVLRELAALSEQASGSH